MCRWTEAALPPCGGGGQPGQPEPWVDVALQLVPGRMEDSPGRPRSGGRASASSISVSGGCPPSAGHGTGSGTVGCLLSQAPSLTPMP